METAIRQFRVRNQIPARLIVEAIRRGYPKFDAPMLSRVESGAYGAELPKDAYALLQSHFPAADFTMFQRHKEDYHRLTCRIYGRLTNEDYAALQDRLKARGYPSVQAWLAVAVQDFLTEEANIEYS